MNNFPFRIGAAGSGMRAGCRRVGCAVPIIVVLVLWTLFLHTMGLFEDAEAQAVALSTFVCLLSTTIAGAGIALLRRVWKSPPKLSGCLAGFLFIAVGSLGAAWVETVFWAFEKITGAQGVAADPNLVIDLLFTMPWYVMMITMLWLTHRRFRYPWTTVALLGGLYDLFADGILGGVLGGAMTGPEYLFQIVFLYSGTFLIAYSTIVLPPVWLFPMDDAPYTGPRWKRAGGMLLPLLPLLPYGLAVALLSG